MWLNHYIRIIYLFAHYFLILFKYINRYVMNTQISHVLKDFKHCFLHTLFNQCHQGSLQSCLTKYLQKCLLFVLLPVLLH